MRGGGREGEKGGSDYRWGVGIRGLRLHRRRGGHGVSDYREVGWGKRTQTTDEGSEKRGLRLQRGGGIRVLRLHWRGGGQGFSDYKEGEWGKGTQTTEEGRGDKGAHATAEGVGSRCLRLLF